MKTLNQLLLCFFLVCTQVQGQIDTTLREFFPLHLGDIWQYRNEFGQISGTFQVATMDSLLPNGYRYVGQGVPPNFTTGLGFYRIDSLLRIQMYRGGGGDTCGGTAPNEISIYRVGEPVGAVWRDCWNFGGYLTTRPLVKYVGISTLLVFGEPREAMIFRFGGVYPPPIDTIYGSSGILVRGIGLYLQEYYERTGYDRLTGAIINGVTYGTVVSVEGILQALPDQISMEQNFPNPFNSVTTIRYDLAQETHVRLIVVDLLGRVVETLVDGHRTPGSYETRLESESLASGVYFYRLIAGRTALTRKMVLQK